VTTQPDGLDRWCLGEGNLLVVLPVFSRNAE